MGSHQTEIVAGRLPVLSCLQAERRAAKRLYVYRQARDMDDILAAAQHIPVEYADRPQLDALAQGVMHQGVVLHAGALPVWSLEEWLEGHGAGQGALILLDGVQDPQNFGAIIRSAAACGASGVLFAKDRSSPITPATMKAAAGGVEYVPLIQETNLVRAMESLKKNAFWLAALDADAPKRIWEVDMNGRFGFIIGNEGDGIRRLVKERSDFLLSIPLAGAISSLNASVSAGIVLAEWIRQRQL